jgi:hypothetical protein
MLYTIYYILLTSIDSFLRITYLKYNLPTHFIKIKTFLFFGGEAASTNLNDCALILISFSNPTEAISITVI